MQNDELNFPKEQLAAIELMLCSTCGEEKLHAHKEVLEVLPVATELLIQCTSCQTFRRWIDWNVTKPEDCKNESDAGGGAIIFYADAPQRGSLERGLASHHGAWQQVED